MLGSILRAVMRLPFAGAILALAVALMGPALVFGLGSRVGMPSLPAVRSVAAQSSNRSVSAPRYDSDLQLQQGGDVLVRETIQIAFQGGPFTMGNRHIPLDRLEGVSDVRLEQTGPDAQVFRAGREQPYTFAVSGQRQGGGTGSGDLVIEWWFPPTTNATRTFAISYRAQGAVRFYDGGDQLYWNVTGNDRPYPIQNSTVTLRMPAGATVPQSSWMTDLYPRQYLRQKSETTDGVTWQASGISANTAFEVRAQWPHSLGHGAVVAGRGRRRGPPEPEPGAGADPGLWQPGRADTAGRRIVRAAQLVLPRA
jgi:hypothetical protein